MNGTPFPSSAPMSSVDAQQLALINGIHNHVFSASQMFIMTIVMFSPLPMSWKLAVFNFLSSSPIAHLSPTVFLFIICAGPILSLLFLYFATKLLISLTKTVFPLALARLRKESGEKAFLELTFPADTEKSAYATEQLYTLLHTLARRKTGLLGDLIGEKRQYSLEIVGTKNDGIRYILAADPKDLDILKRSLISYLPGIKIKEIDDYLALRSELSLGIVELKLSSHFALPLAKQNALSVHDPIAYLTGHMTGLAKDELVAFQVVATPVLSSVHPKLTNEMKVLKHKMYKSEPLAPVLQKSTLEQLSQAPVISALILLLRGAGKVFSFSLMLAASFPAAIVDSSGKSVPIFQPTTVKINVQEILNPYEQELRNVVKEKIDQHLFEATIRILVAGRDEENLEARMQGLISSFGPMESAYQSLATKNSHGTSPVKRRLTQFAKRSLSTGTVFNQNPILSTSEISDIFHFPYTDTTKTEDLQKSSSSDLPAPLSMKQDGKKFDVIVGVNTYGGRTTEIGLMQEDRFMHEVIYGGTGKGKSTLLLYQIAQDIKNGKGLVLIDPHGDLAEEAISFIPDSREDDFVYINPYDIGHPVALNILELAEGLSEDELEIEKEFVTEGAVSLFRREFAKEGEAHAHRLEYILRNCIYTAYTVPDFTIFTVYDLLNDPKFRREVTGKLQDTRLKKFWKNEIGNAGDMQRVKMAFGVTSKIGRLLFSPMTNRMLDNPKSSVDFDKMLNGKILVVNLAKGNIGDDTSELLGKMILSKIQLAAIKRARIKRDKRQHVYLYVDEFQNFATKSFVEMMSDDRKYNVHLVLVQQSTSQQTELDLTNLTLANAGIVIVFRTAAPKDEEMLLPLFYPHVKRGEIQNLPAYHFYMKISAISSEEAFSGETILLDVKYDEKRIERLKALSRSKYTIDYHAKKKKEERLVKTHETEDKKDIKTPKSGNFPESKKRK